MSDVDTQPEVTGEETYCYLHPKTPTKLRCSRCERPICGRCAIPASVGQHCPECVAEARKSAPKVRTELAAKAPVVLGLIVANAIVFVAQLMTTNNADFNVTVEFASFGPFIATGEYYRLVTSMFLHSTDFIPHILFNMFVLYIYGPNVEQAFGSVRFLAMYLIAGFVGSAASYAFGPCALGVGASGAIFGSVGVLLVYLYNRRDRSIMALYMRNLLLFVGINLALGLAIRGIDNWAHMGGLAGGIFLGLGFDQHAATKPSRYVQLLTALGVIAVGVALVAWRTSNFSC